MPQDEEQFHYWAFISYSSKDVAVAKRLHKRLETYRIPRDLVGRPGRDQPVPRKLFPIFRDREELPLSADLGSTLEDALRASRYLVVLCSPHSAKSRWVNEEIRYYKSLGREDRVLALIVDGEPNASDNDNPDQADRECFPPALRYRIGEDGQLTDQRTEPIAGDLRKGGDGWTNCYLKAIAGITGVGLDGLAKRQQKRAKRKRIAAIVMVCLLFVMSGVVARTIYQAQDKANRLVQLYLPEGREAPDIVYGTVVGDQNMVENAIKHDADINLHHGIKRTTPLMYAAMAGHTDICQLLIEQGADFTLVDADGYAAIHHAAIWDRSSVIRYLHGIGENVERLNIRQYQRPIDVAAASGKVEAVETLIDLGAKVQLQAKEKQFEYQSDSPLYWSVFFGHVDACKALIDHGAVISQKHFEDASTQGHFDILPILFDEVPYDTPVLMSHALKYALQSPVGDPDYIDGVIEYTLANGADPNLSTNEIDFDIQFALAHGDLSDPGNLAWRIMSRGSPMDIALHNVTTLWDLQAKKANGQERAMQQLNLLVEHGGSTKGLIFLIAKGKHLHLLDIAFEGGDRIDSRNSKGETPIHIAAKRNQTEMVRYLLDKGIDLDVKVLSSRNRDRPITPLYLATDEDHVETARLLLESGANYNLPADNGPLFHLAITKSKDGGLVEAFLDAGVDPNTSRQGTMGPESTALHVAAMYGRPRNVELLLAAGADPMRTNTRGQTPLDHAERPPIGTQLDKVDKTVDRARCVQLLREAMQAK